MVAKTKVKTKAKAKSVKKKSSDNQTMFDLMLVIFLLGFQIYNVYHMKKLEENNEVLNKRIDIMARKAYLYDTNINLLFNKVSKLVNTKEERLTEEQLKAGAKAAREYSKKNKR